jgi:hypothetical protein
MMMGVYEDGSIEFQRGILPDCHHILLHYSSFLFLTTPHDSVDWDGFNIDTGSYSYCN